MGNFFSQQFGLDGQTAVVSGATGEISGATAEGLCRAGANTVVIGRNTEAGEERAAAFSDLSDVGDATFIQCDTTSKDDLRRLVQKTDEQFGCIDVLVNSAGVNAGTPFLEIEEKWDHTMNVNLKGVFLACQVFGEYLLEQGEGGSVINASSMAALTPLSKVFTYGALKAGLVNLSENLAREWAPEDIRVNCIAPGFFPAEQNREILSEERINDIMRQTPAGRFGEAEKLVGTTLLLASDTAGSFITGAEHCRRRWFLVKDALRMAWSPNVEQRGASTDRRIHFRNEAVATDTMSTSSDDRSATRAGRVNRLLDEKAVAVLRTDDPASLPPIAGALLKGGISAIEVTTTVPGALGAIEETKAAVGDDGIVGVGSATDAKDVVDALGAGVEFVVSPVFKREIVDTAYEAGADVVKVFPASTMGEGYLGSVRAPLPHLRLCPTGGVSIDDAGEWLRASADMVGLGSALLEGIDPAAGDYDQVTANARRLRRNVDAASDSV